MLSGLRWAAARGQQLCSRWGHPACPGEAVSGENAHMILMSIYAIRSSCALPALEGSKPA